MQIRDSAVAGVFYPSDVNILNSLIDNYFNEVKIDAAYPKMLISPHAGYIYSGLVAAHGYKQLAQLDQTKHYKILIVAPSHRVYFHGIAFSPATYFTTPLGDILVEQDSIKDFANYSNFAFYSEEAHRFEHSIETQLPFLQKSLQNFSIIPVLYSDCKTVELELLLDYFLKDEDVIAIISADLSHFHDYDKAKQIDLNTIKMIEKCNTNSMIQDQSCGRNGICAATNYAKRHNLKEKTLDYKNSGDITGDKDKVVGYMSAIFYK